MKKIIGYIVICLVAFNSQGQVKLPAIFSDHMVLQAQSNVPVWGKAKPGSKVSIKTSWSKSEQTVTAASDSSWKIVLETPEPGSIHSLRINNGKVFEINDILMGDVWLCSGQSNMTMPLKGFPNDPVQGSMDEILNSKHKDIRLFDVGRATGLDPQFDLRGSWKVVTPENLANFSATAWFFGKTLNEVLHQPVGLITSSWGGSHIETWMSKNALNNFPEIDLPMSKEFTKAPNQTPTILYNNMIHPIVGYGIKGAIWYQGESNKNDPLRYERLLPAMVADWRKLWQQQSLPFYYLQIAPFDYRSGLNSAFLREAQLKALSSISDAGIGFLMDAGEAKNIHPSDKKTAGQRLAYLALVNTYGVKGIPATGPVYRSLQISSDTAYVSFVNNGNGLTSKGKPLSAFEIAGADKVFYPAEAIITKTGVAVYNKIQVKQPVAVRYAFRDFVQGDLFNNYGLPASSFRTDAWPVSGNNNHK